MNPTTIALLYSWDFDPLIIVALVALTLVQVIGWRRLRARGRGRLASGWRLASYLAGILVLGTALMSPIDVLAGQLFFLHMIQHLLLVMVVPPLLWLAQPFAIGLWALPRSYRLRVGFLFRKSSSLVRFLRASTGPGLAWMVYIIFLIMWHDPNAYDAALRIEWLHSLEHGTFLISSMLVWWHIIGAGPHIHRRLGPGLRGAFTLSLIPPTMLLGVAIAFAERPIYQFYVTAPRISGLSVMADQTWSGLIMWIPGSMMYIVAAILLFSRMLSKDAVPSSEPSRKGFKLRSGKYAEA